MGISGVLQPQSPHRSPPDCCVDLAKWSTGGPGAAVGMSYGHLTSLPGFPSSLLVVSSSFSPSVSCFTLMAIVTSQLNMTLPASWPVCLQIPSDTQESQCEGCSFPSSLSISLAFSKLIALTRCSRACVQSGPKEPSCINTRLSSCYFAHTFESLISSCALYNLPDLSSNLWFSGLWSSSTTSPGKCPKCPSLGLTQNYQIRNLGWGPASWVLTHPTTTKN